MATSAATLMKVIEVMVDARPKTVDKAIEILGGEGLLPAKLLSNRIEVKPRKESRFASVEAEMFATQQKISIPGGFRGTGKAGEGGKITIVDLRGLLLGKTEPKVAKAPKEPKAPKAPKAAKTEPVEDPRITKKVRELLHEWGLDEGALAGCTPTAYKGAKFGVGDIAHLEPGLETGGKGKGKKPKAKVVDKEDDKAASAASASSASAEDSDSDDSDTTEEQDDEFDPFAVLGGE